MKFKLDENLGLLGKTPLVAEGHDVMTVAEQRLSGAKDARNTATARGWSSPQARSTRIRAHVRKRSSIGSSGAPWYRDCSEMEKHKTQPG